MPLTNAGALLLEMLEDRTLLSVVKWTGADASVSTNWSDPKNWSSETSPVAGDTVIFDNTAQNDASTIDAAFLSGGALGDLQINWSGTITIASGVTLPARNTELTSGTVNADGALTISGTLTWLNGTISGTGTVNANGTLVLGAADGNSYSEVLNGCTLDNAGTGSWLSQVGSFDQQNASTFNNRAGASLTIQSALPWDNDQSNSTFNNAGTVTEAVTTGTSTLYVAFNNTASVLVQSGKLSLAGGGDDTDSGSFSVAAGTLGFDGGIAAITTTSTASISGAGTVEFGDGTADIAGTYNVTGTTVVDGGVNGGSVNFSSSAPASTQNLTIEGATLTATGTVNVSGSLIWLNGTISGTGTVNANGTLVLGAADGNSYSEVLNGCIFNNAGSGSWLSRVGSFDQQNDSTFNNRAGASLTIQSALPWDNDQSNSIFNNAGTVTEAVTTGTSTLYVAFNNSASVLVQSGKLSLAGGGSDTDTGSFSVSAGTLGFDGGIAAITTTSTASISGAGTVEFGDGTADIAGTYNVTGTTVVDGGVNGGSVNFSSSAPASTQNLTITGATLTATGTVNVSGSLTWLNGTISGTGTVNANGTLVLGAADGNSYSEVLNGCTLNNAGSATWLSQVGSFDQQNDSTFNNRAGASLTIQSALPWDNDQSNSIFNNAGTVTEAVTTGTSTLYVAFNNSASVLVQSGKLSLAGGGSDTDTGSFSVSAGTLGFDGGIAAITTTSTASISGAGTVEFGDGTADIAGTYNVTGTTVVDGGVNGGSVNFSSSAPASTQNLTITGATLTATGTVNVSGSLTWLNGTISGTGTVNANGTLVLGAADGNSYSEVLNGCIFNNAGSGSWLSRVGSFDQQNDSTFNNRAGASLTIQSALPWDNDQSNSIFNNAGTVTEAVTTGTSTLYVAFNNSASVLVQSGKLSLAGGGSDTDTGSFSVSAGTLGFDGGIAAITTTSTASISGAGTVEFGDGTADIAGTYNVTGTTVVDGGVNGGSVNFSSSAPASTQNLTITGATLTATGTVNVSGSLTWLNGTISGTGTVNANGTLVLGAADGNSYSEVLNGCTLNNAGSATWLSQVGSFDQQNDSTFNNRAGAASPSRALLHGTTTRATALSTTPAASPRRSPPARRLLMFLFLIQVTWKSSPELSPW